MMSVLQVGVYMGKRDFVDRVDRVDPVGEDQKVGQKPINIFVGVLKIECSSWQINNYDVKMFRLKSIS